MIAPGEGLFHDGIDLTAFGTSTISLVASNNIFLNNFQRSIDLTTAGGQILASLDGNRFSSDSGIDGTMVSLDLTVGEVGVQTTGLGGQISLSASANAFASVPLDVINLGIAPDVTIGLDGLTNGFNAAAVPGVFTPTAFGLTDALIDAEDNAFEAIGFEEIDR